MSSTCYTKHTKRGITLSFPLIAGPFVMYTENNEYIIRIAIFGLCVNLYLEHLIVTIYINLGAL